MSSTAIIEREVIVRDTITQPATASGAGARGSAWCHCGSPSCSGGGTGGVWLNEPPASSAAAVTGAPAVPGPRDGRRLRGPARGTSAGRGPGR